MNLPEIPPCGSGGGGDRNPAKRGIHLQGPRPSPLSVNKASRRVGKPPLPASSYPPRRAPPQANREPVIIYAVSPKVIHTEASDFMSVVQRLTGFCSSSTAPSSSTDIAVGWPISPSARLAVLERASPPDKERGRAAAAIDNSDLLDMLDCWEAGDVVDVGLISGILSPAPMNLPAVTEGMFSPVVEPQSLFGLHDSFMSPWGYRSYFPGSPSSYPLFSPAPSPAFDISKLLDY